MKRIPLLIAVALLFACQNETIESEAVASKGVEARLEFAEAETPDELSMVRLLGEVVVPSNAEWVVGPSVEARLVSWSVTTGSKVEVGDTLATLVSPELGDLASVASELRRVVDERQKNVTRLEEAVKAGFKSSASLYEAELSLNEARAQLQRVQRQLGVRNANIRRGQKSQWEWLSPVAGTVSDLNCAPGGLYSAESSCITVVANDAPRLRVDLAETLVRRLGDQKPRVHWTAAGTDEELTLEFERRDAGFDGQTRTQAFYFKGEGLVIGSSGLAEVQIPAPGDAVAVPRMAIVELQGTPSVFVKKGDERPQPVPVKIIGRSGEDQLVTGIAAGDRIVSRGAFALKSVLAFE